MILTFIGMSGIGKTYWTTLFEKHGFRRFSCDEMIEEKLRPELEALGYEGIRDVARWMGQPSDAQYKETSERYLELENAAVKEVCDLLDKESPDTVIDTTGSIIYIPQESVDELKKKSTIIYLEATLEYADQLYQRFIRDPKPVIWGSCFQKKHFESTNAALSRCYPDLLDYRILKYKELADVVIDYETHNSFNLKPKELLSFLRKNI